MSLGNSSGASRLDIRRTTAGPVVRFSLAGELEFATAHALLTAFDPVLQEPGVSQVLLDVSELAFLDSTGMSVMVSAKKRADGAAIGFAVVNPVGMVLRTLTITGLDRLLVRQDPNG